MNKLVAVAYFALFLLFVVLGSLSAMISISGAVVTSGRLVVASYPKPVGHLKGGIVETMFVTNGDKVSAGQVLIRLDDTQTKANLAVVEKRLNELTARSARLQAEERDADQIIFGTEFKNEALHSPEIRALIDGETYLFEARKLAASRRKDQLDQRILQYGQQIQGTEAQLAGSRKQLTLIRKEADGVGSLVGQQLLSVTRLDDLQSQEARLEGELGNLTSSVAEIQGKITETRLQRMQVDDDRISQASSDLRDVQAQIAEYSERKIAAEDDLKHIDILAPQDGVVQDLAVHIMGAVVTPGTPVMTIVPVQDHLLAEVRIAPQDIDEVYQGQRTTMRFSAFNQRTTPEILGRIVEISPDLVIDQKTGAGYYLARVEPNDGEVQKLGSVKLIPGMPIETYIQTRKRTVLSYLLKPAVDQIQRAFKED